MVTILTWILATVLLPASIALIEVCEAGDQFIANPVFFNQTFDKFLPADVSNDDGTNEVVLVDSDKSNSQQTTNQTIQKARNTLYSCLFADDDILDIFGLHSSLDIINSILTSMDSVADLTQTSTYTVPDSTAIPLQQAYVTQVLNGQVSDATQVTIRSVNSQQTCQHCHETHALPLKTLGFSSSTTCPSTATVFASSNTANYNVGSQTCIGYDQWIK